MARLILDSGAVIALAAGNARARQFIERAILERTIVIVPAVVISEITRGGPRDAPINRILKAVDEITPVTEELARTAGRLLAAAGLPNATIEALVVAEAVTGNVAVLLTGDVRDLTVLAAGHPQVQIQSINR